jgi:hypothetical protein
VHHRPFRQHHHQTRARVELIPSTHTQLASAFMAAANAAEDDSTAPGHAAKRDDEEEECNDLAEDDDRGFHYAHSTWQGQPSTPVSE